MGNQQVGHQLLTVKPPQFSNCVVRGGTWTEKDATKAEDAMNEVEETFNTTFWDSGVDAKCELYPNAGVTILVGDVLPELATEDNEDPRSWLVKSIEKKNFGKKAVIFAVELQFRDAQDLTLVS